MAEKLTEISFFNCNLFLVTFNKLLAPQNSRASSWHTKSKFGNRKRFALNFVISGQMLNETEIQMWIQAQLSLPGGRYRSLSTWRCCCYFIHYRVRGSAQNGQPVTLTGEPVKSSASCVLEQRAPATNWASEEAARVGGALAAWLTVYMFFCFGQPAQQAKQCALVLEILLSCMYLTWSCPCGSNLDWCLPSIKIPWLTLRIINVFNLEVSIRAFLSCLFWLCSVTWILQQCMRYI